jgi:hypothetical protein
MNMNLRSAILVLLALFGSHPAAGSVELHPITRKHLSGLWEGIELLGLSVFLVEIDARRTHRAVLVRENRTLVFRLSEPRVDSKGNVSLSGREVTGTMTIQITGSGDATETSGFLRARVDMKVDPKKDSALANLVGDESYNIDFLKPGGGSGMQIQRAETRAKLLLAKDKEPSSR